MVCNNFFFPGVQAMLNPDFRKRPIAEAVLNYRFMFEMKRAMKYNLSVHDGNCEEQQ